MFIHAHAQSPYKMHKSNLIVMAMCTAASHAYPTRMLYRSSPLKISAEYGKYSFLHCALNSERKTQTPIVSSHSSYLNQFVDPESIKNGDIPLH